MQPQLTAITYFEAYAPPPAIPALISSYDEISNILKIKIK